MTRYRSAVMPLAVAFLLVVGAAPAEADGGSRGSGTNNGNNTGTGTAVHVAPGEEVDTANDGGNSGGSSGPNCEKSDGTRDYYRYVGLQHTTMEQQREDIRPEEQRPGFYAHVYCGDERLDFRFFPEDEEGGVTIDPVTLARSVTITPPAPAIVTSPDAGNHLVGIEAWFWVESWDGEEEPAVAGPVEVTVSAEPRTLVVDPGDGSPAFTCQGQPPAFDPSLPSDAQSSSCTHTYERAGVYEATATLVYDLSFTSNIGASGDLGTLEPSSTTSLTVNEAQAIGTR